MNEDKKISHAASDYDGQQEMILCRNVRVREQQEQMAEAAARFNFPRT
jgi:hypothetical protein